MLLLICVIFLGITTQSCAQSSKEKSLEIKGKFIYPTDTCQFYHFLDNNKVIYNYTCMGNFVQSCEGKYFTNPGPFKYAINSKKVERFQERILTLYQEDTLFCNVLSVISIDSNHLIITPLKVDVYNNPSLYSFPIIYKRPTVENSNEIKLDQYLEDSIKVVIERPDTSFLNGNNRYYIGFSNEKTLGSGSNAIQRNLTISKKSTMAYFSLDLLDFCLHNIQLKIKLSSGNYESVPVFNTEEYAKLWRMSKEERIVYVNAHPEYFYHEKFIFRLGLNASGRTNKEVFGQEFEGQAWFLELMTLGQFFNEK